MPASDILPNLTSAMEDYLEAIYHLEKEKRIARVRDIARRLDVKMSSVSSALKTLSSRGLISYDPHQYITLTEQGIHAAEEIVRRHEIVRRFLTHVLKVNEPVAEENACSIEHHLDPEVMDKLVSFLEFVEMCPVDQTRWIDGLAENCHDCLPCLQQATKEVRKRARAQKAALAEGMTIAEADPGTKVIVESIKGTAKFRKQMSKERLEAGAIAEIESKDPSSNIVYLNIKGYHISLEDNQASKVLVKPF
jgi:DtxR family Mn-dependent transcriptional regulator